MFKTTYLVKSDLVTRNRMFTSFPIYYLCVILHSMLLYFGVFTMLMLKVIYYLSEIYMYYNINHYALKDVNKVYISIIIIPVFEYLAQ